MTAAEAAEPTTEEAQVAFENALRVFGDTSNPIPDRTPHKPEEVTS